MSISKLFGCPHLHRFYETHDSVDCNRHLIKLQQQIHLMFSEVAYKCVTSIAPLSR